MFKFFGRPIGVQYINGLMKMLYFKPMTFRIIDLHIRGARHWHSWLSAHVLICKDPGLSFWFPPVEAKLEKLDEQGSSATSVSFSPSLSPFPLNFFVAHK